ncbi:glucose-6-phosphate isomerase [Legionella lansingensis]|uniref:Glucose-6-phosphate isomerase n=1 Tax=Legionella lansingensis TaxID=45067 RepID=A0A0W0VW99_9GAMM|nr:glucose-6-phosphate isomerase [Legionella lansingensis]KTD24355.1 glucose-6-phosphate isomerase [Legionella lansingensis]SNV51692.1 glucose-6-phosphate isomerase [Legionella lansingensis]
MKPLPELNSWIELEKHVHSLRLATTTELNSARFRNQALNVSTHNIHIDFNKQRVSDTTLELLLALANECELKTKIDALMEGEIVNPGEGRPALHTALRTLDSKPIRVNAHDVIPDILATREQIKAISEKIRAGEWLGFSGKPIKDIVNIGMGGSDLGPRFCIKALSELSADHLGYHFVSDVDPNALKNVIKKLKPETTLFIVSSKSFTTKETLYNARKALAWINNPQQMDKHFIAVTANVTKARELGFINVLPIWEWVGGRYSLCSAISLITAIAIGYEQFFQILAGAHSMDKHFQDTHFAHNLPVLLGLLGIWNNNFLHTHNLLILVYLQQLEYFVPYVQQLDMESNGKSIDKRGRAVNYATGPIVWGGLGNQAQHSYYQLLCQGTHHVAVDFITVKTFASELINEMSTAKQQILAHGVHDVANPNGYIHGNKPLNHIQLTDCSPFTLGQLVAMYEHKIYTQSVIWNINAFDQPGVESAKRQRVPSGAFL